MYFLNEVEDNFYLLGIPMFAENRDDSQQSNDELLKLFLSAKQVERLLRKIIEILQNYSMLR